MNRTMAIDVRDDWDSVEVDYDDDELASFMARKYGLDEKKFQDFISDQSLEDALIESASEDDDFIEYLKEKFWDGECDLPRHPITSASIKPDIIIGGRKK